MSWVVSSLFNLQLKNIRTMSLEVTYFLIVFPSICGRKTRKKSLRRPEQEWKILYYSWTSKTKPSWFDKELRSCSLARCLYLNSVHQGYLLPIPLFPIRIPTHTECSTSSYFTILSSPLVRAGWKSYFGHTQNMFNCLSPLSDTSSSWPLTSLPVS